MKKTIILFIGILTLICSCAQHEKKYVIGISQCSHDIWRNKQNAELRMAAYSHDDVELLFAAAYDSDERQVQQIDSLVNAGIDLLIVAPNQVQTISPAIDRAYDKGIPVIVFERKTNSRKYSTFMSADNYELGRTMGEYIVNKLQGKGTVLEVMGLNGSSPAIERHKGFTDALKAAPGITLAASLNGDWTEPTSYNIARAWLKDHKDEKIDLVFGGNDRSAMGARKAISEAHPDATTLYCGIDGLPGKNGGIQLVCDSLLCASYIYPTHGDKLLDMAMRILKGEPYEKEVKLMSAMVTPENAKVLLMESDEIQSQINRLEQLHRMADKYLQELNTQRLILVLALIVIVLALAVIALFYLYYNGKITLRQQRILSTLWNIKEPEEMKAKLNDNDNENDNENENDNNNNNGAPQFARGDASSTNTNDNENENDSDTKVESFFIQRFREVVEARMGDSNLSVEDLAADMNLSRIQLYRKVKTVTGSSPVELLRGARLKRAYEILLTTDKSVSEVAYAVGFTAPSYFTKCFKEEYGMVPGDIRK